MSYRTDYQRIDGIELPERPETVTKFVKGDEVVHWTGQKGIVDRVTVTYFVDMRADSDRTPDTNYVPTQCQESALKPISDRVITYILTNPNTKHKRFEGKRCVIVGSHGPWLWIKLESGRMLTVYQDDLTLAPEHSEEFMTWADRSRQINEYVITPNFMEGK